MMAPTSQKAFVAAFALRCACLMLACASGRAVASPGASPTWLAFKYDADHVLFYICEGTANSGAQPQRKIYPNPVATWGVGGILVTPSDNVMSQAVCKSKLADAAVGESITVTSDGKHFQQALIQKYVEQWGSENPLVRIGALARIADLKKTTHVGQYWLAFQGVHPTLEASSVPVGIQGSPKVLSHLGEFGIIVLFRGDAGWLVALAQHDNAGKLTITNLQYSYGD